MQIQAEMSGPSAASSERSGPSTAGVASDAGAAEEPERPSSSVGDRGDAAEVQAAILNPKP